MICRSHRPLQHAWPATRMACRSHGLPYPPAAARTNCHIFNGTAPPRPPSLPPPPPHRCAAQVRQGVFDFSGPRDLIGFLTLAQQAGLNVLLRAGVRAPGELIDGGAAGDASALHLAPPRPPPAAVHLRRVGLWRSARVPAGGARHDHPHQQHQLPAVRGPLVSGWAWGGIRTNNTNYLQFVDLWSVGGHAVTGAHTPAPHHTLPARVTVVIESRSSLGCRAQVEHAAAAGAAHAVHAGRPRDRHSVRERVRLLRRRDQQPGCDRGRGRGRGGGVWVVWRRGSGLQPHLRTHIPPPPAGDKVYMEHLLTSLNTTLGE
jgi:hypothetical protein